MQLRHDLLIDSLSIGNLNAEKEETAPEAVMLWLEYNIDSRSQYLSSVLAKSEWMHFRKSHRELGSKGSHPTISLLWLKVFISPWPSFSNQLWMTKEEMLIFVETPSENPCSLFSTVCYSPSAEEVYKLCSLPADLHKVGAL